MKHSFSNKEPVNEAELIGFLNELAEISKKYNIYIWGCGCCGSPCLGHIDTDRQFATNLYYLDEGKYEVEVGE